MSEVNNVTLSDKLWEVYGARWPVPMFPRNQDEVFTEFLRRGYSSEEDFPKFMAWIDWDNWYVGPDEPVRKPIKYINVYQTDRAYGGPEEGGWWYDVGDPMVSVPVHASTLESEVRRLAEELKSRVVDVAAGDLDYFVEEHYGEPYPQTRPHYE